MSSAAPLNFIPGATKPIIHSPERTPERPRKLERNARYKSIPLRYSSRSTENEKAVVSVGLAALALLAPPRSENSSDEENVIDIAQSMRSRSMTHIENYHRLKKSDVNENYTQDSASHSKKEHKKILPSKLARKAKKDMGSKRWRSLEKLHNYTLG
uniref:Uncharacterized protein n=1 Tax=Clytia hemisphaerica TaxID=252671 RepID=A0A7M5UL74_9CNID